jgi:hypothetical protein
MPMGFEDQILQRGPTLLIQINPNQFRLMPEHQAQKLADPLLPTCIHVPNFRYHETSIHLFTVRDTQGRG